MGGGALEVFSAPPRTVGVGGVKRMPEQDRSGGRAP
jgi:hypothetical protein